MVYDKSVWPLYTPDLFWALTDPIEDIACLSNVDDTFAEYEIDTSDLPEGLQGLWNANALRNIKISLDSFPRLLRKKLVSGSLCLGNVTLEHQKADGQDITFKMFTGQNILPLFVVKNEKLVVRIQFTNIELDERSLVPYKCVQADSLLVRIKNVREAFFVAACKDSLVTWTGSKCSVRSNLCIDRESESEEEFSPFGPPKLRREHREKIDLNDIKGFSDLWRALPLSDGDDSDYN
jgi:hypothetical protein